MIDIHTHLWPAELSPSYMADYFTKKKAAGEEITMTLDEILSSMEACGIDRSIVLALAFDASISNRALKKQHDYIRRLVASSGGKLAAFCTVNPFEADALPLLKELIQNDLFKGLKLHPNIQCFYPDDERLFPLYAFLEEHSVPVLFHTGGIGLKGVRDCYGDPSRIDQIACSFPGLPVIMGHAGRTDRKSVV